MPVEAKFDTLILLLFFRSPKFIPIPIYDDGNWGKREAGPAYHPHKRSLRISLEIDIGPR